MPDNEEHQVSDGLLVGQLSDGKVKDLVLGVDSSGIDVFDF